MNYSIIKITTLCLLSLAVMSCGKEGCKDPAALNYDPDAKKDDGSCQYPQASLTIQSPQVGQTFGLGDVVQISAQATHTESMHGWTLYLVNTSEDPVDTVMAIDQHDHGTEFNIAEEWTNNVSMHSDMELTINVEVNHDSEQLTEKVGFHCHPM